VAKSKGGVKLQSRVYRAWRENHRVAWRAVNAACALCGQRTIQYDGEPNLPDSFELDHKVSRKRRPDLIMVDSNAQPSHVRCNRGKSAGDAAPSLGSMDEDW
jgi:5-methylcytosine-specific restriction endonuclease McrA